MNEEATAAATSAEGRSSGKAGAVSTERLNEALALMVRSRAADEVLVALQQGGRLPSFASAQGEEATLIAAGLSCRAKDGSFGGPRDWPVALARGVSLETLFAQALGKVNDPARARRPPGTISDQATLVFSPSTVVGNQLSHAAGFGWAAHARGEARVALATFGDGASSAAEFHNGLNFAGVFKANVVFLCRNNGSALSTPTSRQMATETIAEKAIAYGLPAERCHGNDVADVLAKVERAVERARAGLGATLIEAVTVPLSVDAAACPLAFTARALGLSPGDLHALLERARCDAKRALESALAEADAPASQNLSDVYAEGRASLNANPSPRNER